MCDGQCDCLGQCEDELNCSHVYKYNHSMLVCLPGKGLRCPSALNARLDRCVQAHALCDGIADCQANGGSLTGPDWGVGLDELGCKYFQVNQTESGKLIMGWL